MPLLQSSGFFRRKENLRRGGVLPYPLVDSPGGLGRAHSPADKHFDAIYTF